MARRLALLCWLACTAAGVQGAEVAAGVVFAAGATLIVGADGTSRGATRGGELFSGETVETGPDGRAQLKFRDGASLSLQPGTRFRVDEYRFSGSGQANPEDKGFFSLLKGGLRTISGLIGKVRRDQYRVSTVVATIGIRGTEYSANLGDGGLAVATVAGQVEVCNPAGCVLVNPGQTALATGPDRKPELKSGGGVAVNAGEILPQLQQPAVQPDEPHAPAATATGTPPTGAATGASTAPASRGASTFSVPPGR